MKKTAMKISGILTLITSAILFILSIFIIGGVLKIKVISDVSTNVKVLNVFIQSFFTLFVVIPTQLVGLITEVSIDTFYSLFSALLLTFSLLMIFWGIKEILFAKRTDEEFAATKKRTSFMYFIKFMFFLYVVAIIVLSFIFDPIKNNFTLIDDLFTASLNFNNGFLILSVVLAIISLILFILPVANLSKVARVVKSQSNPEMYNNGQNNNNVGQTVVNQNNTIPQGAMQANMPPVSGYRPIPQPTQPTSPQPQQNPVQQPTTSPQPQPTTNATQITTVTPQPNPQPQVNVAPQPIPQPQVNATSAQPTTNQPTQQNATAPQNANDDKVQAELARIERLKSIGAITEENYQAMKNKIMQGNN